MTPILNIVMSEMFIRWCVLVFMLCGPIYLILSIIKPNWNNFIQLALLGAIFPLTLYPELLERYILIVFVALPCINILRFCLLWKQWSDFEKLKELILLVTLVGFISSSSLLALIAAAYASC